jgi:hypothetical protein
MPSQHTPQNEEDKTENRKGEQGSSAEWFLVLIVLVTWDTGNISLEGGVLAWDYTGSRR